MRGTVSHVAMFSAFVSLAAFMAQEVDARGRGGGGRGGGGFSGGGASSMSRGGGGFNRGGSMNRGGGGRGGASQSGFSRGGSYSRPSGGGYSRPSTRPGGGMASQRPATGAGRPGAGGAGRPGQGPGNAQRPGQRPGQGAGAGQRPSQQPGRGNNNIGGGNNNIGSGNNNRVNTGDINIDVDNGWGGGWGGDWNGWGDYPLGAGIAIGAVAGMTAAVIGSAYYALPPGCSPYPYHRYTYYSCAGAFYQPQYEGDTIVYVTVPDPAKNPTPPPQ